jgi:hypothetical protein
MHMTDAAAFVIAEVSPLELPTITHLELEGY